MSSAKRIAVETFFKTKGDFRFDPRKCRAADLKTTEANFLKSLAIAPRDNRWVQTNFGMGQAYGLARNGLVETHPAEIESAHTNIWTLTDSGIDALMDAADITE
jgi:hypothetical protein